MAQSQIIQPKQEELLRALLNPSEYDPSKTTQAVIQGEDLATTILKNKQAQEDRIRTLAEKIRQAKSEKDYKKKASLTNPKIANEIGYIPKESAESILKANLAAQSDEAKLARARMRQEQDSQAPDRIKQIFEVGGKPMAVTYGNKVVEVPVPGGAQLNPLHKTLPADQAQQLADFDTLSSQLELVKSSKKPEFTGPVQSRVGDLAQTVDLPSIGLGASPQRADFTSNINSIRNQLIYLRSGKQINEKEYDRLLSELPNEKRSDVDFDAKLANFEKVFNEIKTNRRNALSTGYNVPGSATPPAPTGNPGQIDALAGVLGLKKKGAK